MYISICSQLPFTSRILLQEAQVVIHLLDTMQEEIRWNTGQGWAENDCDKKEEDLPDMFRNQHVLYSDGGCPKAARPDVILKDHMKASKKYAKRGSRRNLNFKVRGCLCWKWIIMWYWVYRIVLPFGKLEKLLSHHECLLQEGRMRYPRKTWWIKVTLISCIKPTHSKTYWVFFIGPARVLCSIMASFRTRLMAETDDTGTIVRLSLRLRW